MKPHHRLQPIVQWGIRTTFLLMSHSLLAGEAQLSAGGTVGSSVIDSAMQSCLSCHASANQAASQAPALAGQQAAYLQKQLAQFQHAERGQHEADPTGKVMTAIALTLSQEQIYGLAERFANAPASSANNAETVADNALLAQGQRIYVGSCGTCHGNSGQGNSQLKAPRLNILSSNYVERQLKLYQLGARGQHSSDKPGRQMAMMSRTLNAEDTKAVAAYIAHSLGAEPIAEGQQR